MNAGFTYIIQCLLSARQEMQLIKAPGWGLWTLLWQGKFKAVRKKRVWQKDEGQVLREGFSWEV